jgi:hypothetical protein
LPTISIAPVSPTSFSSCALWVDGRVVLLPVTVAEALRTRGAG